MKVGVRMFKIEVVEKVWHTATISDEEEQKVKDYIKCNAEKFEYMTDEEKICSAVWDLYYDGEIEIYNNDCVDSDTSTEEMNWSEFEDCNAEDILSR